MSRGLTEVSVRARIEVTFDRLPLFCVIIVLDK
nr:MAG TPA: hypothetical protein [Caudoviricetes sp.]